MWLDGLFVESSEAREDELLALELYMVGLVARDIEKSVEFYRQLGLDLPKGSKGETHIEVKMGRDLTFFLNASGRAGISESPHVVLEFYLKERSALIPSIPK